MGNLTTIRPYASTSMSLAGGSASNGDDDARVLEDLRPEYIVMYDPDLGFVRRVEVRNALLWWDYMGSELLLSALGP